MTDKLALFSQNIKRLRQQKNIKSYELAKQLGVSPSVLSSWENGRHIPSLNHVITLSEIFEVSIDTLLGINYSNLKQNNEYPIQEVKLHTDKKLDTIHLELTLKKKNAF